MRVERRDFVQRRRLGRNLASAAALALAAFRAEAQTVPSLPTLRIHGRSAAPGEILRIEAQRSDCPAVTAKGTFLGKDVALGRVEGTEASPRFVGWAGIPLDQPPGPARVSVTLECGADTPFMTVERDVTIVPKTFPEQRLDVEPQFVNPPKSALARIEREKKLTAEIYRRRTPLPPPVVPFAAPVPGDPTSEFGARRIFNGQPRSPHPGIDLKAEVGTPVMAAGPGKIALAADLYFTGGTIILDHGEGLFTIYGHLSKIEAKAGATVKGGDRLGLSGATGRVTGPHLHWGAHVGDAIVDPRALTDPRVFK